MKVRTRPQPKPTLRSSLRPCSFSRARGRALPQPPRFPPCLGPQSPAGSGLQPAPHSSPTDTHPHQLLPEALDGPCVGPGLGDAHGQDKALGRWGTTVSHPSDGTCLPLLPPSPLSINTASWGVPSA